MTCIVGLVAKDRVWIGGDSAGVSGYEVITRTDPKVFTNGPFLIGYTSSFRLGQLLRFRLTAPPQDDAIDDFRYMATEFIDAVRHCLNEYGAMKSDAGVQEGGDFLVGYRGGLYHVASDFQVAVPASGYHSVGCGSSYALGAMAALDRLTPAKRIERALQVAEQFSIGVRGPFIVEAI